MGEYTDGYARSIYKQAAVAEIVKIQRDNDLIANIGQNLSAVNFTNSADYCLMLYGAALSHPNNSRVDQFITDTISDIEYRSRRKVKDALKPYDAAYRAANPSAELKDVYVYPLMQAVEEGKVTVIDGLFYALMETDFYQPFVNTYKDYDEYTLFTELKRLYPKGF